MKVVFRGITFLAISLLLLLAFVPSPIRASTPAGTREWDVGTGTLCAVDPPVGCSGDIAMAANGDTIKIQGSGSLSVFSKSVSGSGTFVHKNSAGAVLGSGTWVATQLLSFKSYGGFSAGPIFLEGGLAHIRVHVTAASGAEFDAILTVDCLIGSPPPSGHEGISFLVQPTGLNFNTQVSGETLFIPS